MKFVTFVFWAAAASFSTAAHSEALRCDGDLAGVRDTKGSVLLKCGEPFFTDLFCKHVDPDLHWIPPCWLVEEWYYNPGPGQFIAIFRFERGVVTAVRFGDRVR